MAERAHGSTLHYVLVWLALLALTLLSLALSSMHLGAADVVVALFIAAAKSVLVLLFFMHLVEQRSTNALMVSAAVFFIALLSAFTAADVATRETFPPAPISPFNVGRKSASAVPFKAR